MTYSGFLAGLSALVLLAAVPGMAAASDARVLGDTQLDLADRTDTVDLSKLPPGTNVIQNLKYGPHALQGLDVYVPARKRGSGVIVMVHGGGWKRGDKTYASVVQNKAEYWLREGYVFVSVNYRLYPEVDIMKQVEDVAAAMVLVQSQAKTWKVNPGSLILMGHSAGAHLVSMLSADPSLAKAAGVKRWPGTVVLDTAAFDVVKLMETTRMTTIYEALGTDPEYWKLVSPSARLARGAVPMYIVCSKQRLHICKDSEEFARQARQVGALSLVLPVDMTHMEINDQLGLPTGYTKAVDKMVDIWSGRP